MLRTQIFNVFLQIRYDSLWRVPVKAVVMPLRPLHPCRRLNSVLIMLDAVCTTAVRILCLCRG